MKRVALALLALGSCSRAPQRLNVLLITVDTLRADHLGCYGDARDTSPNLDALARESLRFTHTESPRAKTTPAIASLLSGRYPHEHGVRDLAQPLASTVPLLQEAMRAAGYRTGAIVGNWVLGDERAGLARGFDAWCESGSVNSVVPPDHVPECPARLLVDRALDTLGLEPPNSNTIFQPHLDLATGDAPWFLWLHFMDPHGPYDPPQEHDIFESSAPDPIPPPPERGTLQGSLHNYRVAEYNVPSDARLADGTIDAARVRDRYDGEIHYADVEIGRLLGRLRDSGMLEHTLVVFTADHGESLGEHMYWFEHGVYAYENTCRVPLIVRMPGAQAGVRDADISLVDLAATICELAHVPHDALGGTTRAALIEHDDAEPTPVFCEKVERAGEAGVVQIKSVRLGDWKLIERFTNKSPTEIVLVSEELYDLRADPLEARDLSPTPPPSAPLQRLRRELARFIAADRDFAAIASLLQRQHEQLDAQSLRTLRALGY
jgi:arylsulfatase